jgi:hypothetical protein
MKSTLFKMLIPLMLAAGLSAGLHSRAADYGYPLGSDEFCAVWWAEGAYKIMRHDPVPAGRIIPVQIAAAANEYESVQVIVQPHKAMRDFTIRAGDLRTPSGATIPGKQITFRKVEYIEVVRPTDDYGKPGWYPDPLPLMDQPLNLQPGENHPFFITVKIPADAGPGEYKGAIQLISGEWSRDIPLSVQVWHFALPEEPSMRSSFGIHTGMIRDYHNLTSDAELREVTDKYYRMMGEYKIAPTAPFSLYPMEVKFEGMAWTGGVFTSDTVYAGEKALKVIDDDVETNIGAHTTALIGVDPAASHKLTWYARTARPGQRYCVLVKCYDAGQQALLFENRLEVFTGQAGWKGDTLDLHPFRNAIRYVSVHLFPVFRSLSGSHTGTAWFDDVRLSHPGNDQNLLPQGDFEVDPDDLDLQVDFTAFDEAGEKYLDGLGFNAYHLPLQGLPSGNFYAQRRGVFGGFPQGTAAYDYLMRNYLTMVQDHLEEKGWLGREYVYWFDEPNTGNYPFVREGMEIIHRSAPKITRFITEHQPGPDIMDITEISCTVIGQLDAGIIKELVDQGNEFWSYVCCCPKAPYLSLFIDHDDINMRMWLWLSYKFRLSGILVWSANYWNSQTASPAGYLQNPWEDPMSYTVGYGLPFGKQAGWGNGDGRFFYPPNRDPGDRSTKYLDGPIPCLRLEKIRDGVEDYEYLLLLERAAAEDGGKQKKLVREARRLLSLPDTLVSGPTEYSKDPQALIRYRNEIGTLLDTLYKNYKP